MLTSSSANTEQTNGTESPTKTDYDAIVIGAGFAGLRMIHELRKQGLTFKVIEAGTGVGGVRITLYSTA